MGLEVEVVSVQRETKSDPWGIGIVEKGAGHRVWVEVTDVVPKQICATNGVRVRASHSHSPPHVPP